METIVINGETKYFKPTTYEKFANDVSQRKYYYSSNNWFELTDKPPYLFITEDGIEVQSNQFVYVVNSVFIKLMWTAKKFFDKNESEYFKAFSSEKAADTYIKEFRPVNVSIKEIRERVYLAHGNRRETKIFINTIIDLVNDKLNPK